MMNLYRSEKSRFAKPVFAVVLIIATIFIVDIVSHGVARRPVQAAAGGVLSALTSVETLTGGFFSTRARLAAENKGLRDMLQTQAEQALRFRSLQEENEALRQLLHVASSDTGIAAPVISSLAASPYGTLMIGAGANQGVSEGSLVLTEGGFVLGRIVSVEQVSAVVETVFAPANTIDLVAHGVAFTAEGRGGGNARAEVPRDSGVAVGDIAHAPIFGGKSVGVIGNIESASSSAQAMVYIRTPANLETLRFVYVVPLP